MYMCICMICDVYMGDQWNNRYYGACIHEDNVRIGVAMGIPLRYKTRIQVVYMQFECVYVCMYVGCMCVCIHSAYAVYVCVE